MIRRTGMIADIQRSSFHDGPGVRTTVFFKGCPLNCAWCHNPECISFEIQELFYPEKCIGCGGCAEGCFSGARALCGKEYTVDELLKEIIPDKPYFTNGGGVTFSGGEPMAQKEFLSLAIDACRSERINCAVETSLICYDEKVLGKLDLIIADLKIWDGETHRKYTGVGNEVIKENFKRINSLGIPIIARTPVIPEIDQGIEKISEFMRSLDSVKEYELLPYHPLGLEKSKALGSEQNAFAMPSEEYMEEMKKYAFIR